jgi:Calcineurin-like phosphoesterase
MSFNRRQFLVWAGLGGLGLAIAETSSAKSILSQAQTGQGAHQVNLTSMVPRPQGEPLLRFVAMADTGSGDQDQLDVGAAIARYHEKNPFKLVVLGGDNIYNSGEMSLIEATFEQPYAEVLKRGVKFRAALGNHDIRTENGTPQVQYPGFNMDGRYYSYTEDPAQFFVIDTNGNVDWNVQMAWLEESLAKSTAIWKIVYGHHPIYSSGHYGTNPEFVKRFTPLFKKYKVNLYINGHEHHYERSNPIDGTTYLVTGHGGAHLRSVTAEPPNSAFAVSQFGFSTVELWSDRMVIQGIGTDGIVFDRGIVMKDGSPSNG